MILGAYWTARHESRQEAANRLSRFLEFLATAANEPPLGQWFLKARGRSSARTPLLTDPEAIAQALTTNRRDVDGSEIADLGFRLAIWNGTDVSFEATMGSSHPHVRNAAVLSFVDGAHEFSSEQWRVLLNAAVSAFEPEHGVVTSDTQLMASTASDPWEAGWLTYDVKNGVRQHQRP